MSTTYLYRTPSVGGSSTKATYSAWIKRGTIGIANTLWNSYSDANNQVIIAFDGADTFTIREKVSSSVTFQYTTNRVFRDPAAWYNICISIDTTAASADRIRIYINGIRETSFGTETIPSASLAINMNSTSYQQQFGMQGPSTEGFYGVMAHAHWIDGTAYIASDFGETDSTSGIWVAKTSPSVTYGTNGVFLKFQDTSAFGDDSSGNTNDFTVSGTMTQTKDTPDNNFCTLNPLVSSGGGIYTRVEGTYTNGNNTYVSTAANYRPTCATTGLTAGLWYFEWKQTQKTDGQEEIVGISGDQYTIDNSGNLELGYSSMEYGYNATGGHIRNSNAQVSYGVASAQNDIMGCYIDLTANKLYFAKNGTIMNSGTGYTITAASTTDSQMWVPAVCAWSGTQHTIEFNFGNGYFGTTAVTSGVADAGGEGTFEYDPSAGTFDSASKDFRAICTNNLGTYGG